MLHRLGSILFLLAIITIFLKYFKLMNSKKAVKLHIITGTLGVLAMVMYSILDFVKDKEETILLVGLASILIIVSGTKKVRKKYKWLHLTSSIGFAAALTFNIMN